jgi:hypothetical protein
MLHTRSTSSWVSGSVAATVPAGRALVQTRTRPAECAKQEIDYGRRAKGYILGAFCPATGEAFTQALSQFLTADRKI